MNGSHHVLTIKLTLFAVSKGEWNIKEGSGSNAYVHWYGKKDTSWAKVMPNSEKIKPVALAIVKLQLVSLWKFH